MPLYSDLSLYGAPSSSYSSLYLSSPYSNHSSILAANYRSPVLPKTLPRSFARGYKPHLATITESQTISPIRRKFSPTLLLQHHSSTKYKVQKPIKINTADIDVSVNKYRKYDRKAAEIKKSPEKSKSPSPSTPPEKTDEEKQNSSEEKPAIRRDRALVRLHTVHKKDSPRKNLQNGDVPKSWRQNFYADEPKTEEKRYPRRTPGELLVDKFLIRTKDEEERLRSEGRKLPRKDSVVRKTKPKESNFHKICRAISSETINENLNPGQPDDIVRRQSKQIDDELLNKIRRNSTEILKDNVMILEDILKQEILAGDENNNTSARKKKAVKKKSNEKLVMEHDNKSTLQRRPTQKKIRRTSTDSSLHSDLDDETEKAYQEAIRDISQVEVEEIKITPKPKITATVDVEESPTLKVVVEDVEVVESPSLKRPKKFKFNVTVEEIENTHKEKDEVTELPETKLNVKNSAMAVKREMSKSPAPEDPSKINEGHVEEDEELNKKINSKSNVAMTQKVAPSKTEETPSSPNSKTQKVAEEKLEITKIPTSPNTKTQNVGEEKLETPTYLNTITQKVAEEKLDTPKTPPSSNTKTQQVVEEKLDTPKTPLSPPTKTQKVALAKTEEKLDTLKTPPTPNTKTQKVAEGKLETPKSQDASPGSCGIKESPLNVELAKSPDAQLREIKADPLAPELIDSESCEKLENQQTKSPEAISSPKVQENKLDQPPKSAKEVDSVSKPQEVKLVSPKSPLNAKATEGVIDPKLQEVKIDSPKSPLNAKTTEAVMEPKLQEVKPKTTEMATSPKSPKSPLNANNPILLVKTPVTPSTPVKKPLTTPPEVIRKTDLTPKTPDSPKSPSGLKFGAKKSEKIVPKLAPKEENSSGENFWEKIGTRESVYLDLRRRKLQEKRSAALIQEEDEADTEKNIPEPKKGLNDVPKKTIENKSMQTGKSNTDASEAKSKILKEEKGDTPIKPQIGDGNDEKEGVKPLLSGDAAVADAKTSDNPKTPVSDTKTVKEGGNPKSPVEGIKLKIDNKSPNSQLCDGAVQETKFPFGDSKLQADKKSATPNSPVGNGSSLKKDTGITEESKKIQSPKSPVLTKVEGKVESPVAESNPKTPDGNMIAESKFQKKKGDEVDKKESGVKMQGKDEDPMSPLEGKFGNPKSLMEGKDENPKSPLEGKFGNTKSPLVGKVVNPKSPLEVNPKSSLEGNIENPKSPLTEKVENPKTTLQRKAENPKTPLEVNPKSPLEGKVENPKSPLTQKVENPKSALERKADNPKTPLEVNPKSPLEGKIKNPPLEEKLVNPKTVQQGSVESTPPKESELKDATKNNPGNDEKAGTSKTTAVLKKALPKKDKENSTENKESEGKKVATAKPKLKKEKSEEKKVSSESAQMKVTDVANPAQNAKGGNNEEYEDKKRLEEDTKKIISKRSLVNKSGIEDPDLKVFAVPPSPPIKKEPSPPKFVPLQSNRITQWMHPFKKPEQFDACPVQRYARPKTIRHRYYPRPRVQVPAEESSEEEDDDDDEDEDEEEEESTGEEEESSEEESEEESEDSIDLDELNDVWGYGKVGASTSSDDSGFDSSTLDNRKNKECDVNCHKKCEKLTANLCGVNQKLIVEAIESVKKGCSERDSPTSNPAHNPAFALDPAELAEEFSQSSTFAGFQKSGRITPPATTIPRFRKYNIDDFNFLKVLGKGSFGKVLLAELKDTEYYYAIKCLKKDVVLEDDDVECTLIERKVLALGTKHPYLCHLLCTFQTESHLFFVMEYLNGGDLMFHIQKSGRFPEPRARFYAAEIVSGLKFLHSKGIVYRDLKLDNILLDFDGHVRIADFGMCKLQIFLDRTADTFCGTPDYMAPEIIKGQHYNQNVDWWSFGVLLYEMLIGQSPFSGCDEDELFWSICNEIPRLPKFLTKEASSILTLLLEKDATKRLGNKFCHQGDIMEQPFFHPVDWELLNLRKMEPPFKPCLQHPLDTQYFDRTFTVEKAKLTPIQQDILQSMDQAQFQGFSYTNPNATDR